MDLIAQLADLGVKQGSLIGGEAYLAPDWLVLAKAIIERGVIRGVVTGGRGLSLEMAKVARDAGIGRLG